MEKTLYKLILFLLLALASIDLALVVMASFFGSRFPQLIPFQFVLALSFTTVTVFLLIAWKKYKDQFGAKDS